MPIDPHAPHEWPSVVHVDDPADPALEPYRDLKDRYFKKRAGLFIAEGEEVVRRLLASDYAVASLLLTPQKYQRLHADIGNRAPVYLADRAVMQRIIGFDLHRGCLACGIRKKQAGASDCTVPETGHCTVLILQGVSDPENIGMIARNAAAFGADLLVVGEGCCDPFYRRSIRVSMGNIFNIPVSHSRDLSPDLFVLKERFNIRLIAADLKAGATPMDAFVFPPRVGLVLGNERHGLSEGVRALCDDRVVIPMSDKTDSLNIAVASAVFLYACRNAR